MNKTIFKKETKEQLLNTAIWTLVTAILMVVAIAMYPMALDMYEQMNAIFSNSPEMLALMERMGMNSITNVLDYYLSDTVYSFSLIATIFASLLAVRMIGKDFTQNTAEYLYSKPISCDKIYRTKTMSFIVNILLFNVIVSLISLGTMWIVDDFSFNVFPLIIQNGSIILLGLILGLVYIGLSGLKKKPTGISLALGLMMLFYFLYFISMIVDETEFLIFFTPFALTGIKSTSAFTDNVVISSLIWIVVSLSVWIAGNFKIKNRDLL